MTSHTRASWKASTLYPRKSIPINLIMGLMVAYSVVPLIWLFINATKTSTGFTSSFGLWFADDFVLWDNIVATLRYDDGVFVQWLLNTLLYVVVGAGGAAVIATMAGYGLSHFRFPGRRLVVGIVIGAIAVPGTALAVPTFLLFSQIGLTNTALGVIIPTLLSPFGLFMIWTYTNQAVPREMLEAGRVDGAGELRIFGQIAFRLIVPGFITVLLFAVVSTWNNYFLPLIMLSDARLFPLPVGLAAWSAQNSSAAEAPIYNLLLTGSLLTIVPIVVVFVLMQKYWQNGLAAGGVKA